MFRATIDRLRGLVRRGDLFSDQARLLFRQQLESDLAFTMSELQAAPDGCPVVVEGGAVPEHAAPPEPPMAAAVAVKAVHLLSVKTRLELAARAKEELEHDADENRAGWSHLWKAEALLVAAGPDWTLADRTWKLRDEYERLATAELFADYMKRVRPEPGDPHVETAALRAHSIALVEDVQRLRIGKAVLLNVRIWHSVIILICTIPLCCWIILRDPIAKDYSLEKAAIFSGLFGSCLSILSRLYAIPVKGDLMERFRSTGQRVFATMSPIISLCEGVVAALVMLFFLQSHLASEVLADPLLPRFIVLRSSPAVPANDGSPAVDFPPPRAEPTTNPAQPQVVDQSARLFFQAVGTPETSTDVAKLMLWCFIAGFAERLIPDMLSQLSASATKRGRP